MNTYTAGRVTVNTGSMKVFGVDSEWLANNIKQGDIIIINGCANEIQEVESSTELTLYTTYKGTPIEGGIYTIIRMGEQVLMSDLALEIQKLVSAYDKQVTDLSKLISYIKAFRQTGLTVDEDYDVAQGDALDPDTEPVISEEDIAIDEDIDSLIDDIYSDES